MLADPWIQACVVVPGANGADYIFAQEVGDAVEDDSLGYQINGVLVSDFVYPSWFRPGAAAPFDFGKHVEKPLQILKGGYIGVMDASTKKGWTQIDAQNARHRSASAPALGSRRERRHAGPEKWRTSTAGKV
jgi:hypothetical protein